MLSCQCGEVFDDSKAKVALSPAEDLLIICPTCGRRGSLESYCWSQDPREDGYDDDEMGWGELGGELSEPRSWEFQ